MFDIRWVLFTVVYKFDLPIIKLEQVGQCHIQTMHDFKRKPPKMAEVRGNRIVEQVSNWSYHPLTVQDELDYVPCPDTPEMHRYACRTLARELAAVLALSTGDFFEMLQTQESLEDADSKKKESIDENNMGKFRLRACLESCLEVFSRRAYLVLAEREEEGVRVGLGEGGWYWEKLKEIVLMVLRRISLGITSEQKITLLNGWYLDTCKLLDACLIFGRTYRPAVTDLLRNVLTRGAELEDFQKDFRRVLELAHLRLKQLSEEFEGFAGVDFAALQGGSHQYQNFRNAESTLTKSLLKTLFSAYDLTCNLQAVSEFFPARFRAQLLQQILIFKRFIMIYNKLRYYEESQWRFGTREGLFRPIIDHLAGAIVRFVAGSLGKVALLVRDLPKESPYRPDLKRTYANFWYFTLLVPAVSYEHREDETRLARASLHGRELAVAVVALCPPDQLFHPLTLQHFNREAKTFEAIKTAESLAKQMADLEKRRGELERAEKWRLPSFAEFRKTIDEKTDPEEGIKIDSKDDCKKCEQQPPIPLASQIQKLSNISYKQYDDQPVFLEAEEETSYALDLDLDSFELSYLSEGLALEESNPSKMQRTAEEKRKEDGPGLFDELEQSSIGGNSVHFMSGALSDSVTDEDSLTSVSAMLSVS